MKKIAALLLILSLLLLASCDADNQKPSVDNQQPEESTSSSFSYTQGDIGSVILTDVKKDITFDITANGVLFAGLLSIKYNTDEQATETGDILYELKIDGKQLEIYEGNIAAFDGSLKYPCQGFDICDYLSDIFDGEVTQLDGYSTDANIKLRNNKGLSAELGDKSAFLSTLASAKIIKLSAPTDYNISATNYTITIDDVSIKICGDYVMIGEDLYAITEGDFAFLSDYKYSSNSDGFLPWV